MSTHRWPLALAATAMFVAPAFAEEPATFSIAIKDHQYEPAELKVPANKPFAIKITNLDATAEEFESHEMKIEKVIAGGSEGTVRILGLDPGRYEFIGEYHAETANGVLVAE
jgi:Cupredoxin-like domain